MNGHLTNTPTPSTLSTEFDKLLIARMRNGDSQALSDLYDKYNGAVYALIIKIIRDESTAEEILQETFVKTWKNIAGYDDAKGSIYTWMFNIARNLCIDKTRSKDYKNQNRNTEVSVSTHNQYKTETNVDTIGVKEHLEKLRPEYKLIISMLYFEGYSQKDAADELNIPLGTVKTRCRAALIELRQLLGERGH